jgi:hypothetical protein
MCNHDGMVLGCGVVETEGRVRAVVRRMAVWLKRIEHVETDKLNR